MAHARHRYRLSSPPASLVAPAAATAAGFDGHNCPLEQKTDSSGTHVTGVGKAMVRSRDHVRAGTEEEIAGARFDKRLIASDLFCGKTIEQPVTAGAAQIVLAAAAIGAARRMRRIP